MKHLIFMAAAIILLCSCGPEDVQPQKMTLKEKVSQMLMVRCEDEMSDILDSGAGGIVMFARDFDGLTKKEVQNKISEYQDKSDIPLFISADEEGGTVVRISSNPHLRHEPFSSPAYYYRAGGMDNLINIVAEKSQLLYELGVNMNLGPVADVSTNPDDFIYKRSLGEGAEITAQYIAEAVKAAKRQGVASCLKHFPGYGSNADTHTDIAVDNRPLEEFLDKDLLPFAAGIAENTEAVLISHNIVSCMDSELPASLSPAVHRYLREIMGFKGLIITDDMEMEAVHSYGNAYIQAVIAGNDMIIVSDYDEAVDEIMSGLKSGAITEQDIDRAVENILRVKRECGLIKE